MATISITFNNITIEKNIPNKKFLKIMKYAFGFDEEIGPRRQLNRQLDSMWQLIMDSAKQGRINEIKDGIEKLVDEDLNEEDLNEENLEEENLEEENLEEENLV